MSEQRNRLWRANTPQVEACSKYVRVSQPHGRARKGNHGIDQYVSGGCLPTLSMCRRGFQDLLKVRPSSLFMLCWVFALCSLFLYSDKPPPCPPSFQLDQAILSQTFTCINTQTVSSQLFFLHATPMKMEQTEGSEMSTHKIQTPGNHLKEGIQVQNYLRVV